MSRPMPPVPPAKAGSPRIPAARYTPMLATPHRLPRRSPVSRTKKFCNTMGTGPTGMATKAPAAVKAAQRDAKTIFLSLYSGMKAISVNDPPGFTVFLPDNQCAVGIDILSGSLDGLLEGDDAPRSVKG